MHIVLLNWSGGENNPFTFFNDEIKVKLMEYGCNVNIIELNDEFINNLCEIYKKLRIDLVLTHQGFGTDYKISQTNNSIWDILQIKIISLGSDHPCHNPNLNKTDSIYVLHTYCVRSYAEYANKHFKQINKSQFLGVPCFFNAPNIANTPKVGDFFVFPKNIDDIESIYSRWSSSYHSDLASVLISVSEDVINEYQRVPPFDHHNIIDDSLSRQEEFISKLKVYPEKYESIKHGIHSEIDKIYRNKASELVIKELRDLPLKINGRGWEKFHIGKSCNHEFDSFGEVKFGQHQFQSKYGIIDVVPFYEAMHDRTSRAITYKSGFLSNANIDFRDCNGDPYNDIFFTGIAGNLRSLAEKVIEDPVNHINRCNEIGEICNKIEPFETFYRFLQLEAGLI